MANSPLDLITRYRARLDEQSDSDLRRLIDAYGRMSQRLKDRVDLLLGEIERNPNASIKQMARYHELVDALNAEFEKYDIYLETELEAIQARETTQAKLDTAALIAAALALRGMTVKPAQVPVSQTVPSVLAPGSAAYKRLHELAPLQAQRIIDKLLEGVNRGYGFEKLGAMIVNDLGLGLSDAMRWARTTQMTSYRLTSHNTMVQNSNILAGWDWFAQLDDATCTGPGSCSEQHGTFHGLDENISDLTNHIWNCRCVELPRVIGDESPIAKASE
jgi:hypothetical protein